MTKLRSLFLSMSAVALLASCGNTDYKKTSSGVTYKIFSSSDTGKLAKNGEILKFNYTQRVNDSVIGTSVGKMPGFQMVDTTVHQYGVEEVFPYLRKGDSVVIVLLADSILKNMPPGRPLPFKKGDKLTIALKISEVLTSDQAQAEQMKEMTAERERQMKEMTVEGENEVKYIETYLAGKNIKAQKTAHNVFVVINNPGNGAQIDSGKYVSMAYTGKSFPTDKVKEEKEFESNVGKQPFQFTVGVGAVIPGWDEALKLLKKGGKATFYVPAVMAYAQQVGPGGKPYENLIFDVEVLDVADKAPAAPAGPQMPPVQMPQDSTAGKK